MAKSFGEARVGASTLCLWYLYNDPVECLLQFFKSESLERINDSRLKKKKKKCESQDTKIVSDCIGLQSHGGRNNNGIHIS